MELEHFVYRLTSQYLDIITYNTRALPGFIRV